MRTFFAGALLLACASLLPAAKDLEIYVIDVEGGQATLFVSPSGESMLVDTGWPGFNNRDAERIAAAAKKAGVKKIDYLVVTHYHADHVGGVPQLAAKLPIVNFVDHGKSFETGKDLDVMYKAYLAYREKGNHIEVKPGDAVPVKGLQVQIVAASGDTLQKPLPGAGQPNPTCASFQPGEPDTSENPRSIGLMVSFGDFRMVDLGDLTWDKEKELACPDNKLGTVDLYLTTHHGSKPSGWPQIVNALHPRVAIMNNGARKGGWPAAWQTLRDSPGLIDLWQLHYAVDAGKEHNSPDTFIANTDENCAGQWIRVTVRKDGSFTVLNTRNRYEKTYPAR